MWWIKARPLQAKIDEDWAVRASPRGHVGLVEAGARGGDQRERAIKLIHNEEVSAREVRSPRHLRAGWRRRDAAGL
jgi:hypothetical protein